MGTKNWIGAVCVIILVVSASQSEADTWDVVADFNNTGTQPAGGNPFTYGTEASLNAGFALFPNFQMQGIAVKSKLGPKLNGIINYETWVSSEKMMAPAAEFFKKCQARAAAEGADPLGYYLGGWGNAYISVLGEAVGGAKSTVGRQGGGHLRTHEFKTIMGSWRYGPNGEWTKSGFLEVQYHDIKEGAGLETWRGMSYQTVLTPAEHKTGNVICPDEKAR
jgi:branched-chain amino acid transport system substrate-binding protein